MEDITLSEYLDIVEDKLEQVRSLAKVAELFFVDIHDKRLNTLAWEHDVKKYTLSKSMIRFKDFINEIKEKFNLVDEILPPVKY